LPKGVSGKSRLFVFFSLSFFAAAEFSSWGTLQKTFFPLKKSLPKGKRLRFQADPSHSSDWNFREKWNTRLNG
jgi:hypothetical protein